MSLITIEEAINISITLLKKGADPNLIRFALLNDGLTKVQVNSIINWANQFIKTE